MTESDKYLKRGLYAHGNVRRNKPLGGHGQMHRVELIPTELQRQWRLSQFSPHVHGAISPLLLDGHGKQSV